ncbi:hypothetical protein [Nocardioides sp. R-C-SC26]|uniref:hypothetical protein n=1 Tax=Nocardioides sp. R-C-SC26 TaxID=2870414 RepID=UPI001E3DE72A|nr:hypothetical protein [Nocardioides sp. R-C-SC26]
MTGDLPLFSGVSAVPEPPLPSPPAVPEWQIGLLRKALDARGLDDMTARKAAIDAAVGRPVASLRELTAAEAMGALRVLGEDQAAAQRTRRTWDDRDEDTWIDRM